MADAVTMVQLLAAATGGAGLYIANRLNAMSTRISTVEKDYATRAEVKEITGGIQAAIVDLGREMKAAREAEISILREAQAPRERDAVPGASKDAFNRLVVALEKIVD